MIKFFRNIREQLLGEGKMGKYFKYAIGEILLVMIGILLALQVNNWNEERKDRKNELKALKELRTDLNQNLADVEENIYALKSCQKSNEIVLHHMDNKLSYNDTLNYHFANLFPYVNFVVNQSTYENLKINGLNLISNNSLRFSISDLYANEFPSYRNFHETYLIEHHNNDIKPMFLSEFSSFENGIKAYPQNYERFINSVKNREILYWTKTMCGEFIAMQSYLKILIENLIKKVDKEIADTN